MSQQIPAPRAPGDSKGTQTLCPLPAAVLTSGWELHIVGTGCSGFCDSKIPWQSCASNAVMVWLLLSRACPPQGLCSVPWHHPCFTGNAGMRVGGKECIEHLSLVSVLVSEVTMDTCPAHPSSDHPLLAHFPDSAGTSVCSALRVLMARKSLEAKMGSQPTAVKHSQEQGAHQEQGWCHQCHPRGLRRSCRHKGS